MTDLELSLDGIQAILFDLDGTLRHSRPSFNDTFYRFAAQVGVITADHQRRDAQRWAHYYWAGSPELLDDIEALDDDRDLLLTRYLQRQLLVMGCTSERAGDLAPQLYRRLAREHQSEDWVAPDVPPTLQTLKKAGYTLGVVSNRSQPFHDLLHALKLRPYFEFTLAAGEVDSWKPDGVIFQRAVERAGSCPECTLYVGDNYYADVVGAQRAGLQPVLLDPEGLFPDADCPVIRSLGELQDGLGSG